MLNGFLIVHMHGIKRFHAQGNPGLPEGPGPASFHGLRGLTLPGGITNCSGK